MRLFILALLMLVGCAGERKPCPPPADGREQATARNDRARRATYPDLTDVEFDSLAFANCWTVVR